MLEWNWKVHAKRSFRDTNMHAKIDEHVYAPLFWKENISRGYTLGRSNCFLDKHDEETIYGHKIDLPELKGLQYFALWWTQSAKVKIKAKVTTFYVEPVT